MIMIIIIITTIIIIRGRKVTIAISITIITLMSWPTSQPLQKVKRLASLLSLI